MIEALDKFYKELAEYEVGFFYFSGHGLQNLKNINYIAPINAKLENQRDIETDCVSLNYIMENMESKEAKVNIMIIDACRNVSGLHEKGGCGGMAKMNAPQGSIIAFATAEGKTATDGGKGDNSVYTLHLLQNLKKGEKLYEVLRQTRQDVLQKTDYQNPVNYDNLIGDEFIF